MLSENTFQGLNLDILTSGYVHHIIFNSETPNGTNKMPSEIINICAKFLVNKDVLSLNYITKDDEEMCEYLKLEANQLCKAQKYKKAIEIYTRALHYNPNNNLVLCNRSLCYCRVQEYHKGEKDAYDAIELDPTFYKAWFRYAQIKEAQKSISMAGYLYMTSYMVYNNWTNVKHNPKDSIHKKWREYENILRKTGKYEGVCDAFDEGFPTDYIDHILNFMCNSGIPTGIELLDLEGKEDDGSSYYQMRLLRNYRLHQLKLESKYKVLLNKTFVKYFKWPQELCDTWHISWQSLEQANGHKRYFQVMIASNQIPLSAFLHLGKPNKYQICNFVKRCIAYSNCYNEKGIKPLKLELAVRAYRDIGNYEYIKNEMKKINIEVLKENLKAAKEACKLNGTDLDGWNHDE